MVQRGVVIARDGRLVAMVNRPEACETCRGCASGRSQEMLAPLPEGRWQVGDVVEIALPDGRVAGASLIAYGVPLVALMIGLLMGRFAAPMLAVSKDALMALGAILFTALGFWVSRLIARAAARRGAFEIRAVNCTLINEQQRSEDHE